MMSSLLFSWIGVTDLRAGAGEPSAGIGPIGQAVRDRSFDKVYLLSDHTKTQNEGYVQWLQKLKNVPISLKPAKLSSPTHFGEIYESASKTVEKEVSGAPDPLNLTFHLSPGTPAMAAIWIILAKTRFPAELIESSQQYGVRTASVPFDISADYLPNLLRGPDEKLIRLSEGLIPQAPEFERIIHRCEAMKRVIAMARLAAPRNIPVLILGESGTGKELMARAIHAESPRKSGPFVAVNCGAIPKDLIDSELFGHKKGAFTGATQDRPGYIEGSHKGTLFLDEIGDLPLEAQVRLLRVLQEKEIVRVGDTLKRSVDFRLIAATHKNLLQMGANGQFREDLFHRIAVAILQLPPLRERHEDLGLLIDSILDRLNDEAVGQPGHQHKKLSVSAKKLLIGHPWPGNIRELINTLQRLVIWSPTPTIAEADVKSALLPIHRDVAQNIMAHPLGGDLNLRDLLSGVARSYIEKALDQANGNKTEAAKLIGLPSYQTLTNWMKKYGVADDWHE